MGPSFLSDTAIEEPTLLLVLDAGGGIAASVPVLECFYSFSAAASFFSLLFSSSPLWISSVRFFSLGILCVCALSFRPDWDSRSSTIISMPLTSCVGGCLCYSGEEPAVACAQHLYSHWICLSFPCSLLLISFVEAESIFPSIEPCILGSEPYVFLFGAVVGLIPEMSSQVHHQRSTPTREIIKPISTCSRSLSKLEDCSPLAFKASQTSSCRGHERTFSTLLLIVGVHLSTSTSPYKRYLSPLGERITLPCPLYNRGERYTMFLQVLESSALGLTLLVFYDHIIVLGLKKVDFNPTSLKISTYRSFGDWLLIVYDLVVAGVLFTTWNPSKKCARLAWIIEDACSSSSHSATASFVASPFTAETLVLRNAMISARQCWITMNLWTHLNTVSFSAVNLFGESICFNLCCF